jgi:hypothetical protein
MSINIDKFYRIWDFLKSTPYPVLKTIMTQNAPLYNDTTELYKNVLIGTSIQDGNILDSQGQILYSGYKGTSWGINPSTNLSYPKDIIVINTALQARAQSWNFFSQVFIPGSYAFNTSDMDLLRKMLIDWNASFRTVKDLLKNSSDAFTLDDDDVDKALKGFGIDFINRDTLQNISLRQAFLLSLSDLYKIKGSPDSIIRSLELASVSNPIIREYWIERDPDAYKTLRIRGKAIGKYNQYLDTDPSSLTYNQYIFKNDPLDFPDIIISMDNFRQRLNDISDSHWWYTNDEIAAIEWNPDNVIKLPSITPYFGIEFPVVVDRYDVLISILENIMSNQINTIISGSKNLLPQIIGVSGYNSDLTKKEVWVTGYPNPLALVECFLGFVYCQVRYNEWIDYSNLRNFLISRGVGIGEGEMIEEQTYPRSLEKLIYQVWLKKDEPISVYTVDSVLKMYVRPYDHYYCSTNELIDWWLTLDSENYWNSSTDNNMDIRYPGLYDIFFSDSYAFKYNKEKTDTSTNKILYYSGTRKLDYKNSPFQYFQTLADSDRKLNNPGNRLPFDNGFKSDLPSNYNNNYLDTVAANQNIYQTTFCDYISWSPGDYHDTITHDASQITHSQYEAKYPKNIKWNWAVDSLYFYLNYGSNHWMRNNISIGPWLNEGPTQTFLDAHKLLGFQCYCNGYSYSYVSTNIWVRYPVISNWDYYESPISPDGYMKSTSDIARQTVHAKIDPAIAAIYLVDPNELSSTFFNIVLFPFTNKSQTLKYDLKLMSALIDTYDLVVDKHGYLKQDFSFYYHTDLYLYQRLIDSESNEMVWVRSQFNTSWSNSNGNAIYDGGYKYPNLDLTNRYDADRLLSGINVSTADQLTMKNSDGSLVYDETTNGNGEILVCQGPQGYPQTYYFDITDSVSPWKPTDYNEINNINLGINQTLKSWIDSSTNGDETRYDVFANNLLTSFASYVKNTFQDSDFDIAGIYQNISYSGLFQNLIDFFKPKRARSLYFSTNLGFDDRLRNSIIVDDRIITTKILHEINDYVPKNDGIYISDNISMYNDIHHTDDMNKTFAVPVNSIYGRAVYYLTGFEDNRCNGFYFNRSDLSPTGSNYYLNYHNVALVNITNDQIIYGYTNEWVLALRKNAIDWCDSIYINYNTNVIDGGWYTLAQSPLSNSTPLSAGKVFNTNTLTYSDVNPSDLVTQNNLSRYEIGKINQWNIIHSRNEPLKTTNVNSVSSVRWTPAFCKDPLNIRRIFPHTLNQKINDYTGAGYPENITGERISGFDADLRNPGIQEFSYPYWKNPYPYSDDQLNIKDAPRPIIGIRDSVSSEMISSSDFIHQYNGIKYGIVSWVINSSGSNYSSDTVAVLNNTDIGSGGVLNLVIDAGEIVDISIINAGIYLAAPTVSLYDPANTGSGAIITVTIGIIPLLIPIWWIGDSDDYKTGPVYHKPVYIGVQEKIYEYYPCVSQSSCANYFDVGCINFDGSENPALIIWGEFEQSSSSSSISGQWLPGQYSEFNTQNLIYDKWTKHNSKTQSFTTDLDVIINPQDPLIDQITTQQYWENETLWASEMDNPGSTYCNECDTSLFVGDKSMDGDISTLQIPLSWQQCGVYHNSLISDGTFSDSYAVLDSITWEPTTTLDSLREYDFPVGYYYGSLSSSSSSGDIEHLYELVHVYHRPSGYYYWEIRQKISGAWVIILRSQLKKKEHTASDIYDIDIDNPWHVSSNNFLNGNSVDCAGDRWSNSIGLDTPASYIGKDIYEIAQILIPGVFVVPVSDQTTICGNMVPFQETIGGIQLQYNNTVFSVSVKDTVTISISDYIVSNPDGEYIKIMGLMPTGSGMAISYTILGGIIISAGISNAGSNYTDGTYLLSIRNAILSYTILNGSLNLVDIIAAGSDLPDGSYINTDFIKEHRFIPKEYESLLPTNFNPSVIGSIDHYLLKDYLPLYLYQDSPANNYKLIWDRANSNYYNKVDS